MFLAVYFDGKINQKKMKLSFFPTDKEFLNVMPKLTNNVSCEKVNELGF